MKENFVFYSVFGLIGLFLALGLFWASEPTFIPFSDYASAATTSYVAVSASIEAEITCSTDENSTGFGPLADDQVYTSSPNASTTMSCYNAADGCTLYVKDAGGSGNPGLWNASVTKIIPSPTAGYPATTTLQQGVEGYGIRATTTAVGSGTLTIELRYNTGLSNGLGGSASDVGGLVLGDSQVLASSTGPISNKQVVVTHKAAVSSTTPGGNYDDTITYSCFAN